VLCRLGRRRGGTVAVGGYCCVACGELPGFVRAVAREAAARRPLGHRGRRVRLRRRLRDRLFFERIAARQLLRRGRSPVRSGAPVRSIDQPSVGRTRPTRLLVERVLERGGAPRARTRSERRTRGLSSPCALRSRDVGRRHSSRCHQHSRVVDSASSDPTGRGDSPSGIAFARSIRLDRPGRRVESRCWLSLRQVDPCHRLLGPDTSHSWGALRSVLAVRLPLQRRIASAYQFILKPPTTPQPTLAVIRSVPALQTESQPRTPIGHALAIACEPPYRCAAGSALILTA